ncbi:hypothetical protein MKX03_008651, partial [Papaver bracteatum]
CHIPDSLRTNFPEICQFIRDTRISSDNGVDLSWKQSTDENMTFKDAYNFTRPHGQRNKWYMLWSACIPRFPPKRSWVWKLLH